jgi:hypothetical protein
MLMTTTNDEIEERLSGMLSEVSNLFQNRRWIFQWEELIGLRKLLVDTAIESNTVTLTIPKAYKGGIEIKFKTLGSNILEGTYLFGTESDSQTFPIRLRLINSKNRIELRGIPQETQDSQEWLFFTAK